MPVIMTDDPPYGIYNDPFVIAVNVNNSYKLKPTIDEIEANDDYQAAYLVTPFPDKLFEEFKTFFNLVEAAGGIVWNPQGAILLIYRHNRWDLPKGKIEYNESIAQAAEREVAEECGVQLLDVNYYFGTSYHTYWQHNQRMLKVTYWYDMTCRDPENINPQTEEGIETIRWMDTQGLKRAMDNTFPNLYSILNAYMQRVPI